VHGFTDTQRCNLQERMRLNGSEDTQKRIDKKIGCGLYLEPAKMMTQEAKTTAWQHWLEHPENLWLHKVIFQIHFWIGVTVALFVILMSLTGSMIIYRDNLRGRSMEWLVNLHENLLFGQTGRMVTGIGAICVTALCLTGAVIWWPGIKHWRRSLTVKWSSHFGRFSWDLHSALGFWCFLFILMWGVSGIYFSFPQPFNALFALLDPNDNFTDQTLQGLSNLHFGRFSPLTKALWTGFGLVPAAMAVTGAFLCCHRMIYKVSNRNSLRDESPAHENGARQSTSLTGKGPLATGRHQ
jgi:hypothetical protein